MDTLNIRYISLNNTLTFLQFFDEFPRQVIVCQRPLRDPLIQEDFYLPVPTGIRVLQTALKN
ncbi:hypothetical protein DPMN_147624 [Dreissena polymorpha]|uniref:Uncharacterized protein n=1 Tax=Dreissena polymorpha TaxID=45954 RepID=A0A9D4F8M0_DREPO|nr:hypothetical protein DPMN_147624 [Dreissena polymorpha]